VAMKSTRVLRHCPIASGGVRVGEGRREGG
jgi:hypothetical protein